MTIGRFQAGIAALIYHPPTQTYLLLQRASHRDAGAGAWECVTGRVDQGEGYPEALHREVREELEAAVQIDFIIGTSHFYRGAPMVENELLAVRYACTIDDQNAITISSEHDTHRWMTAEEVYAFLPSDHWLVKTIRRAELMRQSLPPELLDIYRTEGFNLE